MKLNCFSRLRRKLLINPILQLKMLGHTILVSAISVSAVHLSYYRDRFDEIYIYGLGGVSTSYLVYIPFVALFICVLWSFIFSNRIAGPIYRIERQLREMHANSEIQEIHLRKKDYFKPLAASLNELNSKRPLRNRESTGTED